MQGVLPSLQDALARGLGLDPRQRAPIAGALITVWTTDVPAPAVRVVHLGPELGPTARELLGKAIAIEPELVSVEETALSTVEEGPDGLDAWVGRASVLVSHAMEHPDVWLCVDVRAKRPHRREAPDVARTRAAIEKLATSPQVTIRAGEVFRITPQLEACDKTNSPP